MIGYLPLTTGERSMSINDIDGRVGVGVGEGVGVGVGEGVGVGVGVGVGEGVGVGVTFTATFTPLLHTSFLPDLMHVYL